MKVSSSAALGTLTVTPKELAVDPVLQLVIALSRHNLQLTVQHPAKGSLALELPSGKTLHQRNAILRCLGGMGLHNALDDALSGGHSKAAAASPVHAMALASMTSWMSVADHYRTNTPSSASSAAAAAAASSMVEDELLPQLEEHLETRAFLIPSAVPTLADVDVAMLLPTTLEYATDFPNVHRWLVTVTALLTTHGIDSSHHQIAAAAAATTATTTTTTMAPPIFFFGDEEGVELPTKQKPTKQKPAKAQQQEQQQQQQQQPPKKKGGGGGGGKQQQAPAPATASYDISALDIRVGKILKAWPHPDAEKLYCEEIDVGEEVPRQIASGLRPFYASEADLTGQTVMVLCNLKKRNLVGFPSHGMVMCASNADHTAVELMAPPADAKIGERIVFEGFDGDGDGEGKDPEPENKVAKKKIFESLAPDLKTDAEGVCHWKDAVSKTSAGPVKASKGMANAHVA